MKPLIHIKATTLESLFPLVAKQYQSIHESLSTNDNVSLSIHHLVHLMNHDNEVLLLINEICSNIDSGNKEFIEDGMLLTYISELVECDGFNCMGMANTSKVDAISDVIINTDQTQMEKIYEYSKKIHRSFNFININKYVDQVFRNSPHLYYEFVSGGITDTMPRGTYREQLESTVANYKYQSRFCDYEKYEAELNSKLWMKIHGSKSYRMPSDLINDVFTALSSYKDHAGKMANLTVNEFKHLVVTKPEIARITYIAICRLNSIHHYRWESLDELNAALKDLNQIQPEASHEGDVVIELDEKHLKDIQLFLMANTSEDKGFDDMEKVIEFTKRNFDFYLEFLIEDKAKIHETFIGRAIRNAF
ncbi:hypothetical protein LMH73_009810 [Vibrio splendidus]|nr:hypothetical protein [Vibrio splendidus]MCC4883033.1 hypothetical protein [Vibrio splendidus]